MLIIACKYTNPNFNSKPNTIHFAKSHEPTHNQNLPKSMAAPNAPDERTNMNVETGRRKYARKPNRVDGREP